MGSSEQRRKLGQEVGGKYGEMGESGGAEELKHEHERQEKEGRKLASLMP